MYWLALLYSIFWNQKGPQNSQSSQFVIRNGYIQGVTRSICVPCGTKHTSPVRSSGSPHPLPGLSVSYAHLLCYSLFSAWKGHRLCFILLYFSFLCHPRKAHRTYRTASYPQETIWFHRVKQNQQSSNQTLSLPSIFACVCASVCVHACLHLCMWSEKQEVPCTRDRKLFVCTVIEQWRGPKYEATKLKLNTKMFIRRANTEQVMAFMWNGK
jgi:hypothetical protein